MLQLPETPAAFKFGVMLKMKADCSFKQTDQFGEISPKKARHSECCLNSMVSLEFLPPLRHILPLERDTDCTLNISKDLSGKRD